MWSNFLVLSINENYLYGSVISSFKAIVYIRIRLLIQSNFCRCRFVCKMDFSISQRLLLGEPYESSLFLPKPDWLHIFTIKL